MNNKHRCVGVRRRREKQSLLGVLGDSTVLDIKSTLTNALDRRHGETYRGEFFASIERKENRSHYLRNTRSFDI